MHQVDFIWIQLVSVCFCQMSRYPGRTVKPRQLRTSWTSTGTSRSQVTWPQQGPLMMDQEVGEQNLHTQIGNVVAVDKIFSVLFMFVFRSLCWRQWEWPSERRRTAEHFCWWPAWLSQPDGTATWFQVLLQVTRSTSRHKLIFQLPYVI